MIVVAALSPFIVMFLFDAMLRSPVAALGSPLPAIVSV
jgi:hypothetical protein